MGALHPGTWLAMPKTRQTWDEFQLELPTNSQNAAPPSVVVPKDKHGILRFPRPRCLIFTRQARHGHEMMRR